MNAPKIKKFLRKFNDVHDRYNYADHMVHKKSITKDKKDFYEEEMTYLEDQCYNIGNKIKELKPSQYMLNKYVELQDILETWTY